MDTDLAEVFAEHLSDWMFIAASLWGLLDDISTLDDACKDNGEAFRRHAYRKAEERCRFLHSPDGYGLVRSDTGDVVIPLVVTPNAEAHAPREGAGK